MLEKCSHDEAKFKESKANAIKEKDQEIDSLIKKVESLEIKLDEAVEG